MKNNHSYKFGAEFRTEGYPPIVDGNTDGVYTFSAAETGQPFQRLPVNGVNVGFGYASFMLGQVDPDHDVESDAAEDGQKATRTVRAGYVESHVGDSRWIMGCVTTIRAT